MAVIIGMTSNSKYFFDNFILVLEKIMHNKRKATGAETTPKPENFSNKNGSILEYWNNICMIDPSIQIKIKLM